MSHEDMSWLSEYSAVGDDEEPYGDLGSASLLAPAPELRCSHYCMGFRKYGPHKEESTYIAAPVMPFRILGLIVWGATAETLLVHCQVGHVQHVLGSEQPVPALFFSTGLSFTELLASLTDDDGDPLPVRGPHSGRYEPLEHFRGWMSERPEVDARQMFEFDTLCPGDQLALTTKGPLHQLCVWGLALR